MVFFGIFGLFCIICLIGHRGTQRRRKFDGRVVRIKEFLKGWNGRGDGGRGWYWRCGVLGAWIELVKEGGGEEEGGGVFMPFAVDGVVGKGGEGLRPPPWGG